VARIRVLAVVILLLALAGCGTVHAGASAATPSPALSLWRTWGFSGDQIVSVTEEDAGRRLLIVAEVPSGGKLCASALTAKLNEWTSLGVNINLTFQSPYQGTCRLQHPESAVLALPGPLGQRDIVIDSAAVFAPTATTAMRRCSDQGGACTFPPVPPATCSQSSYDDAMMATAPAMHAVYSELGCDGQWLVLDVGWPGGASGCDGPSCTPDLVSTHWFFRASPHGWQVIASSRTAGCTQVHQVEPKFPSKLCAKIPALT
jgi:hypothetical protein